MQSITPLTAADFLDPTKAMLYKLEILDDSSTWQNLCSLGGKDYLKSVSVNLGGAGMTPDPIAGSWSASISNEDGIFHPFHPTSAYKNYFRVGRKVRISIGGNFSGTPYYWQRLIGYMGAPKFNAKAKTVALSGLDYMQALADCILRDPSDCWGTPVIFPSVATGETYGAEMYAEADALDITGEANNMTNWTAGGGAISSVADAEFGSVYAGNLSKTTVYAYSYADNPNVGSFTMGKVYEVTFSYRRITSPATEKLSVSIWNTSASNVMGQITGLSNNTVTSVTFRFTATATGVGGMRFRIDGATGYQSAFRFDIVSIREVTARVNTRYPMPADCKGVFNVVMDGIPYWYGDDNRGWFYDQAANMFYFNDDLWISGGANNIVVSYFTAVSLLDVLADLLVMAGLYASRAAAEAAMSYTDPAITLNMVWFEKGTSALDAVRLICERCNYRFWFSETGVPAFQPAPVVGTVAIAFPTSQDLDDYEDMNEIRNRIVINGIEQGAFSTAANKQASRLISAAFDAASILTYLEKTYSTTNSLFQDQASGDAMAATLLALYKSPKWYSDLKTVHCPVPLQIGDTITWKLKLTGASGGSLYGSFTYGDGKLYGGGVDVLVTAIIRSVALNNASAIYKCEFSSVAQ